MLKLLVRRNEEEKLSIVLIDDYLKHFQYIESCEINDFITKRKTTAMTIINQFIKMTFLSVLTFSCEKLLIHLQDLAL